jgi:hypothetical protein
MKLLVITALLSLTGFGAQAQVTETREVKNYTTLEVKNGIEVIFTQSDSSTLKVETDTKENLSNIITQQKGNTLKIYMKQQETDSPGVHMSARIYISQKGVTHFDASQGALVRIDGTLQGAEVALALSSGATFSGNIETTEKCTIKSSGGAGFRGRLVTKSLVADVTGGAFLKLSGKAGTTEIFCSSANIQAGKFETDRANVRAQKASAVAIYTGLYIKAETDSSSAITYYGEPATTDLGTNSYAVKRENHKFSLN